MLSVGSDPANFVANLQKIAKYPGKETFFSQWQVSFHGQIISFFCLHTQRIPRAGQLLAERRAHFFFFKSGFVRLPAPPKHLDQVLYDIRVRHPIEAHIPDNGAHNHIRVTQDPAGLRALNPYGNHHSQRRFLAGFVESRYFFHPDHAVVGDDVVIVSPVMIIPCQPKRANNKPRDNH